MDRKIDGPATMAVDLLRRVLKPGRTLMRGCTIVARNYLAQAEVLAGSFKRYHPDCPFTILVVDGLGRAEERNDQIEFLTLHDIGLDPGDDHRMPMIYNVTELSTAVKPWLLRACLKSETETVIYFDPDIEIFAPLYDVAILARKHSIVLTPHVTEPIPRDKLRLNESDILASGIYNLGFIAIGPGSEEFLDWWAVRLRRESIIDPTKMRFTDQRWIDFVPGLYAHYILRDPGCNVAYWNLYSRKLKWKDDRYTVNGRPLRFFHYSGYDPDKPHILSKHQGDHPRVLLSKHPGVARICEEYRQKLIGAGFNERKRTPYGFDTLDNGLRIDQRISNIYRDALVKFEEGGAPEPPSPFGPAGLASFVEWLNEPLNKGQPVVTRYMMAIHAGRDDLQTTFPDPLGAHAAEFHDWFLTWGRNEERPHPSLIPGGVRAPASDFITDEPQANDSGAVPRINVAGYFRAELGIGEAARLLVAGLEASDVPYNTISYDDTVSRQTHPFEEQHARGVESDINLICVNADQTPAFAEKIGPEFYSGRYSVGVWFWEVEDFPVKLHSSFNHVDEVWVASDFMRRALLKVSPKPVFRFHLPIIKPVIDERLSRAELGLPDRFTFLFSFDFLSVLERKNPLGLIAAFKRAFKPGEGPVLLIKTINGSKRIFDLEKVKLAAKGHPDIIVKDRYLSPIEKNTLMAECDCYVSLHRSEGFGLTMAEAMALGKPVIATAYSGNTEFMTAENSYLCSYEYCETGKGSEPYLANSRWASPDLDEAARFMREVYEKPDEAKARGLRAADDIRSLHSPTIAGGSISDRICAIRRRRLQFGKIQSFEMFEERLQALEATQPKAIRISGEDTLRLAQLEQSQSEVRKLIDNTCERLQTQVEELLSGRTQKAVEALKRLEAMEEEQGQLRKYLETTMQALRQHAVGLETVQNEVGRLIQTVIPYLESGVKTGQSLEAPVHVLSEQLDNIISHMNATPYMTDPAILRTADATGAQVIGYRDAAQKTEDKELYISFENIFRGSEEMIRNRQRNYLDVLRNHSPVVDLGCGRGEMLDLLKEIGTPAVGVDVDPGMVERVLAKGHSVKRCDAVKYLAEQPDASIGAIFCAQVIEHLEFDHLLKLLRLTIRKLKPDGVFIAETVNPHSHRALKTFWVDLTHNKPIFPEVLVALCRQVGYREAIVRFPVGNGNLDHDRQYEGEYAVIARKMPAKATGKVALRSRSIPRKRKK